MAIGWLTALKAVPWKDVLAAAPVITEHAQALLHRARERGHTAKTPVITATDLLANRVNAIETNMSSVTAEAASLVQLVTQLAGQAESLTRAVQILRTSLLVLAAGTVACIVVSIVCVATVLKGGNV